MNDSSIIDYIEDFLSWELDAYEETLNIRGIAVDLADKLDCSGYCVSPYTEYDKALICPINKKREKYCGCTLCASHTFCEMLRKEGYV